MISARLILISIGFEAILEIISFISETSFDEADTSESSQTDSKQTDTTQDSSEQVSIT